MHAAAFIDPEIKWLIIQIAFSFSSSRLLLLWLKNLKRFIFEKIPIANSYNFPEKNNVKLLNLYKLAEYLSWHIKNQNRLHFVL